MDLIGTTNVRSFASFAGLYFAAVFALGFVFAPVREWVLRPAFGTRYAEVVEILVMLVAIFYISAGLVKLMQSKISHQTLGAASCFTVVLIVLADLLVGISLRDMTWLEVWTHRDLVSSVAYHGALLFTALVPIWHTRRRRLLSGDVKSSFSIVQAHAELK